MSPRKEEKTCFLIRAEVDILEDTNTEEVA